jgi:ERCC4-type nuclease
VNGPIVPCNFTIIIDDREKWPYRFERLRARADQGGGRLLITTVTQRLEVGDYTIQGHEDGVVIERKTLPDLYGSVVNRDNFIGRLRRMNELLFAAIVIESTWIQIASEPPPNSAMNPLSVIRSLIQWTVRYPRVHWIPAGDQAAGEAMCFRLLEAYHKDQNSAAAVRSAKSRRSKASRSRKGA